MRLCSVPTLLGGRDLEESGEEGDSRTKLSCFTGGLMRGKTKEKRDMGKKKAVGGCV